MLDRRGFLRASVLAPFLSIYRQTNPELGFWESLWIRWFGVERTHTISVYIKPKDGDWHHISGTFNPKDGRTFFLDGMKVDGREVTEGRIQEYAVWDVVLTSKQMKALGDGLFPQQIRPDRLVYYLPLNG